MGFTTTIKATSFALLLAAASAGSAQAQFGGFNPLGIIPNGGRINPGGIINQGIGVMQEINRQQQMQELRRQQAIAAEEARQRRAALMRTKAGRAQLAQERHAEQQRAARNERMWRDAFRKAAKSNRSAPQQVDDRPSMLDCMARPCPNGARW